MSAALRVRYALQFSLYNGTKYNINITNINTKLWNSIS